MAFNDSKWGMVFPTRQGPSQGAGYENKILQGLGGADGIRTKIVDNADGSSTTCRTRAGFPEFTTVPPKSGVCVDTCMTGPIEELAYTSREWFPEAATDEEKEKYNLKSTDGIFTLIRTPLKKLVTKIGTYDGEGVDTRTDMEFWYSRDDGTTAQDSPSELDAPHVMREIKPRTFYKAIPAQDTESPKRGMGYAVARIKTVTYETPRKRCRFTHTFAYDYGDDPPVDPTCINSNSVETGLDKRVYHSDDKVHNILLAYNGYRVEYILAASGWFLDIKGGAGSTGASSRNQVRELTALHAGSSARPEAVNLAKVTMMGAMWHGLAIGAELQTKILVGTEMVGATITPDDFVAPSNGSVYYVKSPATLDMPDMPDNFAEKGAAFLNYALFTTFGKTYSTTGQLYLGVARFIHFDLRNEAYVLSATANILSTPAKKIAGILVKVYSYGKIDSVANKYATATLLGTITIPINPDNPAEQIPLSWYLYGMTAPFVNASPDGRKVCVELRVNGGSSGTPGWGEHAFTGWAVEVLIPPEKINITASVVWQYMNHVRPASHYYKRETLSQFRVVSGSGGTTTYTDYDIVQHTGRGHYRDALHRVKELCHASYSKDGVLGFVEAHYELWETDVVDVTTFPNGLLRSQVTLPNGAPPPAVPTPINWEEEFLDTGYGGPSVLIPEGSNESLWVEYSMDTQPGAVRVRLPRDARTESFYCGVFRKDIYPATGQLYGYVIRTTNNTAIVMSHEGEDAAGVYTYAVAVSPTSSELISTYKYLTYNPLTETMFMADVPVCYV